jgi:tryptophan synthase, alpha chain (EC 4.2.1.20)
VFGLVRAFRAQDAATPLVLMGYANPVHAMGYAAFAAAAATAGADGAIIVDLPPEEDSALRGAFDEHGLALIRLATPTTDQVRLARILDGAMGFYITSRLPASPAPAAAIRQGLARRWRIFVSRRTCRSRSGLGCARLPRPKRWRRAARTRSSWARLSPMLSTMPSAVV